MKKILTLFTALTLLGSMTVVQATDYYYRGNQTGWNEADAVKLTSSTDGYYAYFEAKSYANNGNKNNNFKIALTAGGWDYNSSFVTRGFNGTDISNSGGNKSIGLDWDDDNICVYCTEDFYVLVYFPNTAINTTDKPIICASTTLPDNSDPIVLEDYTIYFKNTPGWDNVYVYLYGSSKTFGDKGVGDNDAAIRGEMSKIGDGPFYKYDFQASTAYTKVCFNNENHGGTWSAFWQDECSWSDGGLDFEHDIVLWIPNTASSEQVNSCTYFNTGAWSVYPPVEPGVAFSGLPSNVYQGQTVTFAATSENVENPTYTFQVKQIEGEYGPAVTEYTFDEAGTYKVKVEVREEGASTVLADVEQVMTCTKYSLMLNDHSTNDKGSEVAVFSSSDGSVFTATWNCASADRYYFYTSTNTSADAHSGCDYLNANQSFTDGGAIQIYLYGDATGCYNHSFTLNAPRAGEYTFTLTLGGTNSFKCDYPEALAAEVSFGVFPANIYKTQELNLNNYVSSENVTTPAYTFYLDDAEIADPAHFSIAAAGSHSLKVEVREAGETGDALATSTTTLEIKTLYLMQTDGTAKGTQVEECATTDGTHFTASWTCSSSTDVYFYVTNNPASDAHSSCDYLGGGTLADGTAFNAYLYGSSAFENAYKDAYKLVSPWDGEYVFTLTFNAAEPHSFTCDFPVEPEPEYTVAGSASAFGSNWDVYDVANKMDLDGGVYKLTKTDRELLAGNIEFKVVKDHDYAKGEWPASNYQLAIPENGKYTIDITFDPANVGNEISATATKTGEIVVIPTIKIDGSWDWGNATTLTGDETSVSTTIHLDASTHYFKMLVNGDHRSNGYYYHRGYTGAEGITSNAGDMSLGADIAGDYTFTWTFATNAIEITFPLTPIAPIGGKFTINAKGDTAIFARGNLQYQQSSNTWRCAPNQYEWKGTDNLQMGNSAYEGWVDLFCWSIGAENNYGATSAYLTTTYFNKSFVDWGGLFSDTYEWSTLSINEWNYLLYSRANANNLWGMAMIGNNLGMIILPDEWTAPSGVTFVPGTIPTTDLFADEDCLDPTMADQDHWRLNPDNLPANKFTVADWEILEAAGAVFLPYGGRRSGGYGNHTNRQDQTITEEYAYAYYENYYGSYWTSTVAKPAEGKSYWLPLICGGCNDVTENWGRGSHGWWENGRYGHSVRLVTRIPKVEYETVRTGLTPGNFYTICLPKEVTAFRGASIWNLQNRDEAETEVYLEEAELPFAKGTPFIIQATADKLEVMYTGDATDVAGVNGALHGTLVNLSIAEFDALPGTIFILKDNAIRPRMNGYNYLSAYRAYINYGDLHPVSSAPQGAPGKRVIAMPMQKDAAQGIDNIEASDKPMKVVIDGTLYILRGEKVYDATGRMVK